MISLYFHFPFCSHRCPYCHFLVLSNKRGHKEKFLSALLKEWELRLSLIEGRKILSIYFGGGTPTLFVEGIQAILTRLRPSCEITVEANPEDITLDLVGCLKDIGVNRISIGVQSFNNALLRYLGRTHDSKGARQAVLSAWSAGIQNISIDLMYDIPYQTCKIWEESIVQACALPITHLSLYNLVFEPHTVFYNRRKALVSTLPTQEMSVKMIHFACIYCEKMGLHRYEISSFGEPSIHNSGYWNGREFLGFGPSAFSYMGGKRFCNTSDFNTYLLMLEKGNVPIDFEEQLDPLASLHERLIIGLRLMKGVEIDSFPPVTKEILVELEREGLLIYDKPHLFLSEKGCLFYDSIAERLVLLSE